MPGLTIMTTSILISYGVPFKVAFILSRTSIERSVAEVRVDRGKGAVPRTCGMLRIKSIELSGGDVKVTVDGSKGFDTDPFLQLNPAGIPTGPFYGIEPLGHGWYWVNRQLNHNRVISQTTSPARIPQNSEVQDEHYTT